MDSNFQVKMVGYQDKSMKSELGRVVRHQLGFTPLRDWIAVIARVLSIILCIASFTFTALFAIGWQLIQGGLSDVPGEMYLLVLVVFSFCLLLVCFGIRKRSDPLRENLWPAGAVLITAAFVPDHFQINETYFANRVEYRTVQSVFETNSAFYLFVRDEQALMLRKREFIQGDPEQFRDFIQQRTGRPVERI